MLAGFLRASAKGWHWADKNRDQAVDMLVKEYPNLDRADERVAADVMLAYSFGDAARAQGWGTMDPANLAGPDRAVQRARPVHRASTPKVDEVITLDILKATQAAREGLSVTEARGRLPPRAAGACGRPQAPASR